MSTIGNVNSSALNLAASLAGAGEASRTTSEEQAKLNGPRFSLDGVQNAPADPIEETELTGDRDARGGAAGGDAQLEEATPSKPEKNKSGFAPTSRFLKRFRSKRNPDVTGELGTRIDFEA